MPFVFYDTETTGTNVDFDQILQFAAILTDDQFREIDRLNLRCRLLPWIVPSPAALHVTNTHPEQLIDTSAPSHFEMVGELRRRLLSWSPAIFVGYNSINFDEELLRRALWQCLFSPWLTTTGGNKRLDLLTILRAAAVVVPSALKWDIDAEGRKWFRLDRLAPLNGFPPENAHDALVDVQATIHLAKLVSVRAPTIWQTSVERASRISAEASWLDQPVFILGGTSSWYGYRIGSKPNNSSALVFADLNTDWEKAFSLDREDLRALVTSSPPPIRSVSLNRFPLIFSADDSTRLWQRPPNAKSRIQHRFLKNRPEFCVRLVDQWSRTLLSPAVNSAQLEQSLYEGFSSREDERRMDEFHACDWSRRSFLIRTFQDHRLRRIAQRIVFTEAPEYLSPSTLQKVRSSIATRILSDQVDEDLWRTALGAFDELDTVIGHPALTSDIKSYLTDVIAYWQAQLRLANASTSFDANKK